MATIIDSLLVTLGLDTSGYKKGAAEAEKAQNNLEGNNKKSSKKMTDEDKKRADAQKKQAQEQVARNKAVTNGLNKMRNEALGLLAVFTAGMGIKDFISNTINSEASLSRVSKNLNMTALDLAEYKLANEKAGGSAEGMVAQLQQSASDIAKLKIGLGPSESMQAFFRYGGSTADLKDGNTYLKARSDIIAKIYKTDPTKAMEVAKAMGVSEDTFNLLKDGSAALEKHKQAVSGLASAQARNADRAEAFRQRMVDLKNSFSETGVNILTAFMPALEKLAAYAQKLSNWFKHHQKDITKWMDAGIKGVSELADKIVEVAPIIIGLGKMIFDGWSAIVDVVKSLGIAIKDILPESWKDKIGEFVATIMAKGGSSEAQSALASATMPVGASSSVSHMQSNSIHNESKGNTINIVTNHRNPAEASEVKNSLVKYGFVANAATGAR